MCFIVSFRFIAVMAQKKDRNNAALKKRILGIIVNTTMNEPWRDKLVFWISNQVRL